ncbi:MAG: epimerase, partial [Gemmatimonadetes bacterium]|nr:epimerase [Gemmatimonadota bacterium]
GDLSALEGDQWDAVVDTCGYVPRIVRQSARKLVKSVNQYAFISTGVVYSDLSQPGFDESAPLHPRPRSKGDAVTPDTYGPFKAECERVIDKLYPDNALHVRAGLIVGPHDPTDRFTYWPVRVARGGRIAAPVRPDLPVQFIDARDLGVWLLNRLEAGDAGAYNVSGPEMTLTFGKMLEACQKVCASETDIRWIPEELLKEHDVTPFREMPLWIPEDSPSAGLLRMDITKAVESGLFCRSLEETVRDLLRWNAGRAAGYQLQAGCPPEKEQALITAEERARTG